MTSSLTLKLVQTSTELAQALSIREQVFIKEQQIPAQADNDGLDAKSAHLLVVNEQKPIATARLFVDGLDATASRIAVLSEYRGQGIGRRLVATLEKIALARGAKRISLRPHSYLETFYSKLGYLKIGEKSFVGKHELITMVKELN